ncbi:hypothetical protein [Nonomuraea cavernae]|uniref:Uncharacterized protein n=1 Tax=Nonomuraea cavernae TaxID=2045107 RepID=A0A917YPE9_9ACTN|nr:hypothetical protein [Nonomuraea cavernae]MCA2184675.1 hypothetical protein [Nonomuraea cavernae]GGO63095.1 hypothetical protein GCM10012289_09220 [Nonomuraea cavernae]
MKGKSQAFRPIDADRHFGCCTKCGRVRYGTKRTAKVAARQVHPGQNLRAFKCGDYWHYGPHTVAKRNRREFRGARPTLLIVDEATRLPWEAS